MNHFTKLAGLGLAATLFLASCEKDEDRVVMQPGTSLAVTSSTNSAVLLQDNASAKAVTYTWTPVDFGFQAAVKYTLQFDKKGGDFSAPVEIEAGNSTSQNLTVAELNGILLRLKVSPGTAGAIDSRVKASVGGASTPLVSAVSTFTGTPYKVFIQYPSIYVPGSHQGWAPDKAPFLASVNSDKNYEGFVYFPDASTSFKFTPAPNWDNDYGVDAAGPAGTLKAKGGDITIAGAGYYRFRVDLNTLKYMATKTTWAVIGAATPGGWDKETPMVYDPVKKVWKVTLPLKADELKFRANNAWDIDFGDNKPVDNIPDYGGENIKVAAAGTYTVTLDLSQGAGNYSYSIEK
ncbi:SusF/SusE family outer membrane protein [Hymenobacter taeanensis]|uniref:SusF/SusE family outer membrane protein n=1 Tax=Hymenobacter taeanensis TaxID=2735321 RepID=A0A6M6BJU4_9BACT|nr:MULTISPECIES: SusE domain-containing protein [Hymenobacter]QJX48138.1 SusF/SusE family outer membrane protein [Hymenobacter taeanensis]UOQ82392.1 SusE domain-containing protein [Hymenobacter sp. 5414T-23]